VKAKLGERSKYGTIGGVVEVDGAMYCTVAKHLLTELPRAPLVSETHGRDDDDGHESDSSDEFDISEPAEVDALRNGCSVNEIPPTKYELPEFHIVGEDSTQKDLGLD
jgi:hypothetical protein